MSDNFYTLSDSPYVPFKTILKTLFINRLRWFTKHLPRYRATHRQLIEYSLVAALLDWYERGGKEAMADTSAMLAKDQSNVIDPFGNLGSKLKEIEEAARYFDQDRARKTLDLKRAENRLDSMLLVTGTQSSDNLEELAGVEALRRELYEEDTRHLHTIIKYREMMRGYR